MARLLCILLALLLPACGPASTHHDPVVEDGETLAKTYCGTCHLPPPPANLDKMTWLTGVLPQMGLRLGVTSFQGTPYTHGFGAPAGYYPTTAVVTPEQWNKIVDYFYNHAPDTLPRKRAPISKTLDRFAVRMPHYPTALPPVTCYLKIDPGNKALLAGDGIAFRLRSFNRNLQQVGEVPTIKAMADIAFSDLSKPGPRSGILLNMGLLDPHDVGSGNLQRLTVGQNLSLRVASGRLYDSLTRPVALRSADLDGDGKEDLIVCGFGNYTGSLFWLRNAGDHYEKKILRPLPGAMQVIVEDINHDGRPDILALMAQGDEGIFLYENKGNGSFQEKPLLRFSPEYGSISMDLADFNGDGFPDIAYACGDNADFSKVLKPYHGVYIFLNDGKWNFKQQYFFAINGCFKVLARDFDLDGDVDLATIAYFPDFEKRPEESFVYLQNEGKFEFKAFTFPQHNIGRWLTFDAGDIDGDGDIDLVLGNMSVGPTNIRVIHNWKKGPAFVVLENRTR
jgi:hypothetical protein